MQWYDFIFVVLVYKNAMDLKDFLNSLTQIEGSYRVVIVNSYYNKETMNNIKNISLEYDCDFINIDNKGYGYGNNRGIEYALEKYDFKFLVISNPDIEIKHFSIMHLEGLNNCISGPKILTLSGKNQNPYFYNNIKMSQFFKYISSKTEIKAFWYLGVAINKVDKYLRLLVNRIFYKRTRQKVYALHGSFIVFGKDGLTKLVPLFDENMFLFAEEEHLARLAESKGVSMYYLSNVEVLHKEDGSMWFLNEDLHKMQKKSYITYYENWFKKNRQ